MIFRKANLVVAALFYSAVAMAGSIQPASVDVVLFDDGSGMATGDMVTARFSENDVEIIGCGIRTIAMPNTEHVRNFGFCQATTSENVSGICSTIRSDLLDTIKATGDYSFITFNWNKDGECTRIGFSTQSIYIPKHIESNDQPTSK